MAPKFVALIHIPFMMSKSMLPISHWQILQILKCNLHKTVFSHYFTPLPNLSQTHTPYPAPFHPLISIKSSNTTAYQELGDLSWTLTFLPPHTPIESRQYIFLFPLSCYFHCLSLVFTCSYPYYISSIPP